METTTAIGELQETVAGAVAGIKDAALAEARDTAERRQAYLDRYDALAGEYGSKTDLLARLEVELESLPSEAYRANLDGDTAEESRLRTRYVQVRDDVPALRSRVQELESELSRFYDTNRAAREGIAAAVEHQAMYAVQSGGPDTRRELLKARIKILESLDAAIVELGGDTGPNLSDARTLEKQREDTRKLLR